MATIILAAQELDVHRQLMQSRQEQQDDAPPAQTARPLPPAPQPGITQDTPSALPDRVQGPPAPGGPATHAGEGQDPRSRGVQPEQGPSREEEWPTQAPDGRRSHAQGEGRTGKRNAREAPEGSGWKKKWGGGPPKGTRSPAITPTVGPRAARPTPKGPNGAPQRRSPGPPAATGRGRRRSRTPRASPQVAVSSDQGARPVASRAPGRPPRSGTAPAKAAAWTSSRSYARLTEERDVPRTAGPPRGSPRGAAAAAGHPERREPAAPRKGGRSHSGRRRRPPPQDSRSRSRSRRRSRSRGHDRHGYWPDRPRHRPASEGGNEGAVQARRGQPRPYSPQGARRQREESLQDQRKAKGWHQNHGDRAGPNAAYWCGQNRHTEDPRPGGKGKSQSKGGGRRGKGSKARNRQHAQHGQPRTENQRRFQQRRHVHATRRLTTALQGHRERQRGTLIFQKSFFEKDF